MGLRKVETRRSAAYGSYGSGSSNSISGVASIETGCHVHWIGLQWRGSQSLCLGNGCRIIHFPLFLFTTTNTRGGGGQLLEITHPWSVHQVRVAPIVVVILLFGRDFAAVLPSALLRLAVLVVDAPLHPQHAHAANVGFRPTDFLHPDGVVGGDMSARVGWAEVRAPRLVERFIHFGDYRVSSRLVI